MRTILKILLWLLFWPLLLIPKLWRLPWVGKPIAVIWSLFIGLLALAAIVAPSQPGSQSLRRLEVTSTPVTSVLQSQTENATPTVLLSSTATATATQQSSSTPTPQSEPPATLAPPTPTEEPSATATIPPTATKTPSIPATATPPIANARPAQVTRIVDGDTIYVLLDGVEERVRYIGIDTPERGQPGYQAATAANRALVEGQTLFLVKEVSDHDRDGRLLRQLYLADGRWINGALVSQGWAQPVRYPPDIVKAAQLEQLAVEAAQAKIGFWSGSSAYDGAVSYGFTTQAINLRTGPGTNFEVSNSVAPQTPLTIFGRDQTGDWLQVRLPDRSGGWMSTSLLTVNVTVAAIPLAQNIPQPPLAVQPTPPATPQVSAPPATQTTPPTQPAASSGGSGNPNPFTCNGGCAVAPDPSCAIKGNVNSKKQKIYHIPGWRDYNRTDIKPEEGDRWFCTEAEATAAGFRAPENP